jgi:uncharacterized repeat protein (TIGR03803 family)
MIMSEPKRILISRGAALAALTVLTYGAARSQAQTLTTLYSFSGENGDGAGPYAAVLYNSNGTLYGTTGFGGVYNSGTVFELTPPASGGAWTETVLHSFGGGDDGTYPYGGVVAGANGVLYGTTNYGGASGMGIVYELAPPAVSGGAWTETVLHNFGGSDGAYPYSTVTVAANGALYGTTELGGTYDFGTVYELTPPAGGSGAWTETVLYNFTGGSDGCSPYAVPTFNASGAIYSTTVAGGSSDKGTIFKLAPPVKGSVWKETVLHNFNGSDGGFPYSGVVLGANGDIYGTTAGSVNAGNGSAFLLTPPSGTGKTWTETVLEKFNGNSKGGAPHAVSSFGPGGVLYGTAFGGGTGQRFNGSGLIYQLTPPSGSGSWTETVLYIFQGGDDGASPNAPLIPGANGVFYSTTLGGGSFGQGTVFAFTP